MKSIHYNRIYLINELSFYLDFLILISGTYHYDLQLSLFFLMGVLVVFAIVNYIPFGMALSNFR